MIHVKSYVVAWTSLVLANEGVRGKSYTENALLLTDSFKALYEKFPGDYINDPSYVSYDPVVGALYVGYRNVTIEESVELDSPALTVADIGKDGGVVGVEILI